MHYFSSLIFLEHDVFWILHCLWCLIHMHDLLECTELPVIGFQPVIGLLLQAFWWPWAIWRECKTWRGGNVSTACEQWATAAPSAVSFKAWNPAPSWRFLCKLYVLGYSVVNTVAENSSVFSPIQMRWLPSARACGSKTLYQQTPPVFNWRCQLTYNGRKTGFCCCIIYPLPILIQAFDKYYV